MKGLQKILQCCGMLLGVVAFILMLACSSMTYQVFGGTGAFSGILGIFGGEYLYVEYKATWTAIIAFILFIVALLSIICALVLPYVSKKTKELPKILTFVAAGAIIVAGVLLFFEVGAFKGANNIESWDLSLGIGWIFSAILGIVSGCLMLCSNFVKGK
ncbi:MAG: hypothetical protein IJ837_01155 [Clostridia bacterium]|nr:hypothetical protein [Clostridia bacterium]